MDRALNALTVTTLVPLLAAMSCEADSAAGETATSSPAQGAQTAPPSVLGDVQASTRIAANDSLAYDQFGEALATDGRHVIVGASQSSERGGAAYIYPLSADGLGAEAALSPNDRTRSDNFGSDVDVSGDTAIVGALDHDPRDSRLQNQTYGGAYFFRLSDGSWTQEAFVQASDRQLNQEFGGAVAISGDHAVVGAVFSEANGNANQGQAYLFRRADGGWAETQILTAPEGQNSDHFGTAVDIDGDQLFVSAVHHRGGRDNHSVGAVWVFARQADGQWQLETELQPDDLEDGNNFGSSIEIDGDVAIVGAHLAHGADYGSGTAYVFRRGAGGWQLESRLAAREGRQGDDFGYRVAIDGSRAVIGAWLSQVGDEIQQGAAYVFERGGSEWIETAKVLAGDGAYGDLFGSAVALAPAHAIVGASGSEGDSGPDDRGVVYLVDLTP